MQELPAFTLFPYTTLFRSAALDVVVADDLFPHQPQQQRTHVELRLQQPERRVDQTRAFELVPLDLAIDVAGDRFCILHQDRKSTRLNSSHMSISYAVFCLR